MANKQRKLEALPKQMQALQMRIEGHSYDAIAQALGYEDRSGAYRAVQAVMKEVPVPAVEEYRELQNARLEALIQTYWPNRADINTGYLIVRVLERQAALLGIDLKRVDAPVQNLIKVYKGIDVDAV